jgi:hypothetical protein
MIRRMGGATDKAGSTEPGDKSTESAHGPSLVSKVRTRVAQVLWLLFVLCALFLAVGALLVALGANEDNPLVAFVLDGADAVDLGVFSPDNGIKEFTGEDAATKNALFNWGIGAVAYLVVGRIVDRIVRP